MIESSSQWPSWIEGGVGVLALAVVLYDKFTGRLTRVVVESETIKALKKSVDGAMAEMSAELAKLSGRLDRMDEGAAAKAASAAEMSVTLKGIGRELGRLARLPEEFAAHEARDEERFESIKSQLIDLKQAGREDQAALGRRVAVTEAQIARVAPRALRAVRDE